MKNRDYVLAFIILFIFLFFFMMIGTCFCYSKEIDYHGQYIKQKSIDYFKNLYSNWEKQLDSIKKTHNIGEPTGVLSYKPEQLNCETSQNLLVQSNVAFKPVKRAQGCTYIDKRWPS